MRRYILLSIVPLIAIAIALYAFITYDPHAPHHDWPVLKAATTVSDAAQIMVGANVHASAALDRSPYWECVLAAHPEDPDRLFTAVMYGRGTVNLAGFYSDDGGATWQLGCDLAAPPGHRNADPSAAFGADGAVYLVHMHSENGGTLHFHASTDGGRNWEQRAVVNRFIDRPWIAVDTTAGPHHGNLYCIGQTDPEPIIYVSTDQARTLDPLAIPPAQRTPINTRPANPVVLPDGAVLFAHADRNVRSGKIGPSWPRPYIDTLRSTDGGRTITRSASVNTRWWHDAIHSSPNSIVGAEFPQLAADPGSSRLAGRVYCVWADGSDAESARIFFCASPDGGTTWDQPIVISEQPMRSDPDATYAAYVPSIAVNRDGVIAVSWYDRRGLPGPREVPTEIEVDGRIVSATKRQTEGWNVRMRLSLDGGATWLPSVQLNEEPSRGGTNVGHTAGLAAAADGRFHAAWIDDRTGAKQLWTAVVEVKSEK